MNVRHPRSETWGTHIAQLEAFLGSASLADIPAAHPLKNWLIRAQEAWRSGKLDEKQIADLKRLHIPLAGKLAARKDSSAQKKSRLDDLMLLLEKIDGRSASPQEIETATHMMNEYRARYLNGQLSPTTARRLGLGA